MKPQYQDKNLISSLAVCCRGDSVRLKGLVSVDCADGSTDERREDYNASRVFV